MKMYIDSLEKKQYAPYCEANGNTRVYSYIILLSMKFNEIFEKKST